MTSDPNAPSGAPRPDARTPVAEAPVDWRRRAVLALAGVVAVGLFIVFATSFLPRWWAHRVGDRVRSSFTSGILLGLLLGGLATLAALSVARLAVRRRTSWRNRGLLALAALVLAGPNLTTLGIVLGRGSAAHAGERTLDVNAPGFRGASLIGVVLGVAAFAGLQYVLVSRRGRQREIERLRGELHRRDGADGPSGS